MQKLYVNPLPVRIWHWANAIGFVLLIATGLQSRWGWDSGSRPSA